MTDDLYFNISERKLSITTLYLYFIPDAPKYDVIWTESSDVLVRFISEILKYESSDMQSLTEKLKAVLFTSDIKVLVCTDKCIDNIDDIMDSLLELAGMVI